MLFKQKNKRNNKEGKSSWNNYEKAKQEYLEHISKTTNALHSWKLIALFSLITTGISICTVTYLSTRSSLIPYVIEVDQTGNAKGINPAYQTNYEPTEVNIQFYLREFVHNARWISSDIVLQGIFYKKSIALLGREAKEKYNKLVENENWKDMIAEGFTRDVQIESVNKISGTFNSYQIRWRETIYKKGSLVNEKKLSGIFAIEVEQPRELEELKYNPLGIRIQDYHITNEGV